MLQAPAEPLPTMIRFASGRFFKNSAMPLWAVSCPLFTSIAASAVPSANTKSTSLLPSRHHKNTQDGAVCSTGCRCRRGSSLSR